MDDNNAHLDSEQNEDIIVSEDSQEEVSDPSDKLTPDHPRFKEVNDQLRVEKEKREALERKLDELQDKISERQSREDDDQLDEEERIALEKIERNLAKRGYVRREDLDKELSVDRQALQLEKLQDKYSGKNGYPKFVADDVTIYAKRNGFSNLEAAYKDMHWNAIVEVEAKKMNKVTEVDSEKPTGRESQIPETGLTPEKIGKMTDEEYRKNRAAILASLKNSAK